jgi:hypothetical protein
MIRNTMTLTKKSVGTISRSRRAMYRVTADDR